MSVPPSDLPPEPMPDTLADVLLHVHPSVLFGVVALALIYAGMAAAAGKRATRSEAVAFGAALATIMIALGPVDALADAHFFTAHMAQHMLLALVVPPLLLLGTPAWMVRPLLRRAAVARLARGVTSPIAAFTIYNGFLAALHTPPVYDLMLRNEPIHIALHIGLLITGTIMWWPLVSPLAELPRLSYPAQTLYLFLLLIPMAAVSAPITLAGEVIYPWYLEDPHPWSVDPLTDQVWGGLLMWIGGGVYFMAVFSLIFFHWSRCEDRDEPPAALPDIAAGQLRAV